VWVGVWVCTPDRSDLKLGTVVILDTTSQSTDFGFKTSRVKVQVRVRIGVRESVPNCIYTECTVLLILHCYHERAKCSQFAFTPAVRW